MKSLYLTLASAPALMLTASSPEQSGKQGTILFYHGFGASKEQYIDELRMLADAGFLTIGIDIIGQGERRYPDFEQRFPGHDQPHAYDSDIEAKFLADVLSTAQEVPDLFDDLLARGWAYAGHMGIAGISMGGFITYAAITIEKRINAAVSVVGSPHWNLPWQASPHLHLERFFPTALLSQATSEDETVPAQQVRAFHEQLAPYYAQTPKRLGYIEYSGEGHDLSQEILQRVRTNMVEWFQLFLS